MTTYTYYDCETYLNWDKYISLYFNDLYKDCSNTPITDTITEDYEQVYNPILIHIKNESCIMQKQAELKTETNLYIRKRKPKIITPESGKDSKWLEKRAYNTKRAIKSRAKQKQKTLLEAKQNQIKMKYIKLKKDYLITYIKELKLKKLLLCDELCNNCAFTTSINELNAQSTDIIRFIRIHL